MRQALVLWQCIPCLLRWWSEGLCRAEAFTVWIVAPKSMRSLHFCVIKMHTLGTWSICKQFLRGYLLRSGNQSNGTGIGQTLRVGKSGISAIWIALFPSLTICVFSLSAGILPNSPAGLGNWLQEEESSWGWKALLSVSNDVLLP